MLGTHCVCKTDVSFCVPTLLAIFSRSATFRCTIKTEQVNVIDEMKEQ